MTSHRVRARDKEMENAILLPPYAREEEPLRYSDPDLVGDIRMTPSGELMKSYVTFRGGVGSVIDAYDHWIDPVSGFLPRQIQDEVIQLPEDRFVTLRLHSLDFPVRPSDDITKRDEVVPLTPADAIRMNRTYAGILRVFVTLSQNVYRDVMDPTTQQRRRELVETRVLGETVASAGEIPIMLKSSRCYLSLPENQSDQRQLELGGCPANPGGYFIIGGVSYILHYIDKLLYNKIQVMNTGKIKYGDITGKMTCLTIKGSTVVKVFYSERTGNKNAQVRLHKYLALNHQYLGSSGKDHPNVVNALLPYLLVPEFMEEGRRALAHTGLSGNELDLEVIRREFRMLTSAAQTHKVLTFLNATLEYLRTHLVAPLAPIAKIVKEKHDKAVSRYKQGRTRKGRQPEPPGTVDQIRENFLYHLYPHIPNTPEGQISKLHLHTFHILRVIGCRMGQPLDDPDSYAEKKFDGPASTLRRMLSTLFRESHAAVRNNAASITDVQRVAQYLDFPRNVGRQIASSFRSKNWGPRGVHTRKELSDILKLEGLASHYAQINRVKVQTGSRSTVVRNVKGNQWGFVSADETPEGAQCGTTKYLSILAYVSIERDDHEIVQELLRLDRLPIPSVALTELADISLIVSHVQPDANEDVVLFSRVGHSAATNILMINGRMVGFCNGPWLQRYLIWLRRYGEVVPNDYVQQLRINPAGVAPHRLQGHGTHALMPRDSSVIFRVRENILYVYTNEGRPTRPLLTATVRGTLVLDDHYPDERQYAGVDVDHLLRLGAIEYVDPGEQQLALVAVNLREFRHRARELQNVEQDLTAIKEERDALLARRATTGLTQEEGRILNSLVSEYAQAMRAATIVRQAYTHCQVDPQSVSSVTELFAPLGERNLAPRNLLQCQLTKQALGIVSSTQTDLIESTMKALVTPEPPLFATEASRSLRADDLATGETWTMAFSTAFGYNIEDAIVVGRDYVEGGGMMMWKFIGIKHEIKSFEGANREEFARPPMAKNESRDLFELVQNDGTPVVGGYASEGKYVIGIVGYQEVRPGVKEQRNLSIRIAHGEEGVVDRVVMGLSEDRRPIMKVRIRQLRKPNIGDKFTARYGQKVTIGRLIAHSMLPYIVSGEEEREITLLAALNDDVDVYRSLLRLLGVEEVVTPEQLSDWLQQIAAALSRVDADAFLLLFNEVDNFILNPVQDQITLAFARVLDAPTSGNLDAFRRTVDTVATRYLRHFRTIYLPRMRAFAPVVAEGVREVFESFLRGLESFRYSGFTNFAGQVQEAVRIRREAIDYVQRHRTGLVRIQDPGVEGGFRYEYRRGYYAGSDRGIVPNAFVNPLSIVARMTMGFLYEVPMTKMGAMRGERVNASMFQSIDDQELYRSLRHYGYADWGQSYMRSGYTGRLYPGRVNVGGAYYLSLKHHARDKIGALNERGAIDKKTKQPIAGTKSGGTQKFSEMERDAAIASGASLFLQERLSRVSDETPFVVCARCANIIPFDAALAVHRCGLCGNEDPRRMRIVVIPGGFNYLLEVLALANISIGLRPT